MFRWAVWPTGLLSFCAIVYASLQGTVMYNEFVLITGYSYVRRIFFNSAPSVRGQYPCPRLPIPWLSQLKPLLSNILRTADALRISITEFVYLGIYCWCNKTADSTNASIETWSRWRDWVNLTVIVVNSDYAELLHTFFLHLNKNYETWFLNWKKKIIDLILTSHSLYSSFKAVLVFSIWIMSYVYRYRILPKDWII